MRSNLSLIFGLLITGSASAAVPGDVAEDYKDVHVIELIKAIANCPKEFADSVSYGAQISGAWRGIHFNDDKTTVDSFGIVLKKNNEIDSVLVVKKTQKSLAKASQPTYSYSCEILSKNQLQSMQKSKK